MIEMIGMVGFLIMVGIPLRWLDKRWSKQRSKDHLEWQKKDIKERIKKMMDTP